MSNFSVDVWKVYFFLPFNVWWANISIRNEKYVENKLCMLILYVFRTINWVRFVSQVSSNKTMLQYSKIIKCDANVTCSKNPNSTHSFQLQYNFISGSKWFFRDNKTIEPWTFYFMFLVAWLCFSKIKKIVAKGTKVFLNAN